MTLDHEDETGDLEYEIVNAYGEEDDTPPREIWIETRKDKKAMQNKFREMTARLISRPFIEVLTK